ncbi:hypothetical protein KUV85_11620 [Nocardioides panacisoli]|uniref:hypothetical protein n=1 Tax=Nocardioides panacisoli TaxID=627624 RepID=UPI001C633C52|nr:hypothetical protein [Nocardioides panacisoli]QYJ02982.1 hypothetical protein KUV85_11620 [Nocardioides panacisoli]
MFKRHKPYDASPGDSWRTEMKKWSDQHGAAETAEDAAASPVHPSPGAEPFSGSTGTGGTTTPSESPARDTVDEMLARLGSLSSEEPVERPEVWHEVTEEATSHSEALKSALQAQQQAQAMLELAARERADATSQGEQILLEARAMANRLAEEAEGHVQRSRAETKAWAADQRRAVSELVANLEVTARDDAEEIRLEARRTARIEAEEEAARYVARVTAAGAKDAEILRARASDLLAQSTTLLADARASVAEFADAAGSFVVGLQRRVEEMEAMLVEHRTADAAATTAPEDLTDDEVDALLSDAGLDAIRPEGTDEDAGGATDSASDPEDDPESAADTEDAGDDAEESATESTMIGGTDHGERGR